VRSRYIGLQSYDEIEKFQKTQVDYFRNSKDILVLGIEFHPVVTMGVRGNPEEDLYSDALPVVKTDRGGQATVHSPGQLVIYPMLDLREHGLGVKDFVQILMDSTCDVLTELGISSLYSSQDPGVYTMKGKIAFCGLKIDRGIVRHGISINIHNDLSLFGLIRPCGHAQAPMDLVSAHKSINLEEFFKRWMAAFQRRFELSQSVSLDMTL
jgi:lipoyl(octanoyl) transferase